MQLLDRTKERDVFRIQRHTHSWAVLYWDLLQEKLTHTRTRHKHVELKSTRQIISLGALWTLALRFFQQEEHNQNDMCNPLFFFLAAFYDIHAGAEVKKSCRSECLYVRAVCQSCFALQWYLPEQRAASQTTWDGTLALPIGLISLAVVLFHQRQTLQISILARMPANRVTSVNTVMIGRCSTDHLGRAKSFDRPLLTCATTRKWQTRAETSKVQTHHPNFPGAAFQGLGLSTLCWTRRLFLKAWECKNVTFPGF